MSHKLIDYSIDTISRVSMLVCRHVFRNSGSWPYMSQSSFVHLARQFLPLHGIEVPCIRGQVSVVHVRTDKLPEWINANQHHSCSIILIVGNADDSYPVAVKLPNSVRHCFAQNLIHSNDTFFTSIPIGLEDRRFGRLGMKFLYKLPLPKKKSLVLVPPMSPTNSVREATLKKLSAKLSDEQVLEVDTKLVGWIRYFFKVRKFKFVLCLEGNGFDTHRLWETLYLNSFPVLLRSEFSEVVRASGFPVLIVDSIEQITRDILFLHEMQFRNFSSRDFYPLWMPFWKDQVSKFVKNPTDA